MPEIERKFLLSKVPEIDLGPGAVIVQGYMAVPSGELRLRRKDNDFFLTVKGDGTISREEWEEQIPEWVFRQLSLATEGRRIEKMRFTVPWADLNLEIDVFTGALSGLILLECEFSSEAVANAFQLPPWVVEAREVTTDASYKNKNLAIKGRPETPGI